MALALPRLLEAARSGRDAVRQAEIDIRQEFGGRRLYIRKSADAELPDRVERARSAG